MKPFLQGKKILSVSSLGHGHGPAPVAGAKGGPALAGLTAPAMPANVSVETVKEGDKIVRLVVKCGCGERIEIECLYLPGT